MTLRFQILVLSGLQLIMSLLFVMIYRDTQTVAQYRKSVADLEGQSARYDTWVSAFMDEAEVRSECR